MTISDDGFIELNRTFFELPRDYTHGAERDDLEISEALGLRINKDLGWAALLKLYRVILLAEAGSGKTEEIRQTARNLRSDGRAAFFLRLEHVSGDLKGAFEEGTYEEFQAWLESDNEGWLLLDSVDEARLKNPLDFEKAVRKIAYELRPALQRVHVVITGRVDAWRAKTDLALCNKQLEYKAPDHEVVNSEEEDEISITFSDDDSETKKSESKDKRDSGFKVYSISNLSADQVTTFLRGKGVLDSSGFLQEIDRHDAWVYTTRPQDLIEVIDFWTKNKRIGSRLELIENSIDRRLSERKENTAAAQPISLNKAREGVKLIAAASTLLREATIRVPDGSENLIGIDVRSLLPDWTNEECRALLTRPVFDEAIYGSVRFHHRSVREYLTARWLQEALSRGASRKAIKNLFFQKRYGLEVLVPSMRPVLSWLVLFDKRFLKKACKIEPEIVFEGGDPSKLPAQTRRKFLSDVCRKIDSDISKRSVTDYSAVQRFANADLADEIKSLSVKYKDNEEITSFLMRMVWQGRIKAALPEARDFATLNSVDKYTRISAIRAVKEIGSKEDFHYVLNAILSSDTKIDRRILAEAVENLNATKESVEWVFKALEKTEDYEKYSTDGLGFSIGKFAGNLEPDNALLFLKHIDKLLERGPVIERRFCEVSEQFGWLINCGAKAIEGLMAVRHPYALSSACLSILSKIPPFRDYSYLESGTLINDISNYAKDWSDLNFSLFWKDVEVTRKNVYDKKGDSLTYFWQAHSLRVYWSFDESHFERVKQEVFAKESLDDRLVALSLAYQIYKDSGRPIKWRSQLRKLAESDPDLTARLMLLLNPPALTAQERKWKQQQARWKRRDKRRQEQRKKYHAGWIEWLNNNFETLRDNELLKRAYSKGAYLNAQRYLLERMRKTRDGSAHWTQGNWQDLVKDYGEDVAKAFRDGLVNAWRFYKPILRSEKEDEGGTPVAVILGLSGIEIEADEADEWPNRLSYEDVQLVCRYAFQELNGFPNWFPRLHKNFPTIVRDFVLSEIDWELERGAEGKYVHYIIDKISWSGRALWDDLAPELMKRLKIKAVGEKHLSYLLKIIQSSSAVPSNDIALLAAQKCKTLEDINQLDKWFAAWIGVDSDNAIGALSSYLNKIDENSKKVKFAMKVSVNLVGERRVGSSARDLYKSPKHLKSLYLLMHKYIKVEEDIERAGKGVYSPGLRDHAQDARDGLIAVLKEIPGEETYRALKDLTKKHPVARSRAWMMHCARERAEIDAEPEPMTYTKFLDFKESLQKSSEDLIKFLELKPNWFGLGINLNEVWIWLRRKLGL